MTSENQNAGSEQPPESPTPRRHGHGRGRHYRGRGSRPRRPRAQPESTADAAPPPPEAVVPPETPSIAEASEAIEPISERIGDTVHEIEPPRAEPDYQNAESEVSSPFENAEPEPAAEPSEPESFAKDIEPETRSIRESREVEPEPEREREPVRVSEPEPELDETGSPISRAIEKVQLITKELRDALDQMEDILELLEEAERQQIGDDREVKALRKSLENLHRGRLHSSGGNSGGPRHHPHR
jgi:hypothetical protein